MIDTALRKVKEVAFAAPARLCNRILSPLAMTLIAFHTALVASYLLWRGYNNWALWLWIISRILDGMDGTMARLSNRQSELGGYLDFMCDAVVYTLFPIAAAFAHGGERILIALILLFATYYVNLASWAILSAILEKKQARDTQPTGADATDAKKRVTTVIMPRGIIEGFETAVIYAAFCVFTQVLWHLFVGMAILTMLSACIRVVWAIQKRKTL